MHCSQYLQAGAATCRARCSSRRASTSSCRRCRPGTSVRLSYHDQSIKHFDRSIDRSIVVQASTRLASSSTSPSITYGIRANSSRCFCGKQHLIHYYKEEISNVKLVPQRCRVIHNIPLVNMFGNRVYCMWLCVPDSALDDAVADAAPKDAEKVSYQSIDLSSINQSIN